MRLLVCGSRTLRDKTFVFRKLDTLLDIYNITVVIQGEAKGADTLGKEWAETNHIEIESYPADWEHKGRSAGPQRNKLMLIEGRPDLVAAFIDKPLAESRGTKNMVTIASRVDIGVNVYELVGLKEWNERTTTS